MDLVLEHFEKTCFPSKSKQKKQKIKTSKQKIFSHPMVPHEAPKGGPFGGGDPSWTIIFFV